MNVNVNVSTRILSGIALSALLAILGMVAAAIVFETGQIPIRYVLRAYGWPALLAALPLVYFVIALRRGPSRPPIALGIAYPLVILVAFAIAVWQRFNSGTEGEMDVVYSFVFFWFNIVWAIFILCFVPLLACLLAASALAYAKLPKHGVVPIAGWIAVLLIAGAVATAARTSGATPDAAVPEYRPDVVDNAIGPLNECIWRAAGPGGEAGFPKSLSEIRNVSWRAYPTSATQYPNQCAEEIDALPNQPFTAEYTVGGRDATGRAHTFTLTFIEKTRFGGRPRVTWYDQTGLRRDGVRDAKGAIDSVRLAGTSALRTLLVVQHLIDEWAQAHGGEVPRRIVNDYHYRDGKTAAPPGVFATEVGECSGWEDEQASCIEKWERTLIYMPLLDRNGRPRAYTLAMQPVTYYDYQQEQPIPSRTHFRASNAELHSFGGWRPANESDPTPDAREVTMARAGLADFLEQRARARR